MGRPEREHPGRSVLVAVAIATASIVTGVSPAHATAPGENGRIVFRRYFNAAQTRGAIFTINPDGTGIRQLTHRGNDLLDTEPDWSPDGKWIAFQRVEPGKPVRLFKMRANGTHLTGLAHNPCLAGSCVEDVDPQWSPNGKLILFTRFADDDGLVYVMRSDGTHVRQVLGTARYGGGFAQWSPDGTSLVFSGTKSTGAKATFTIRLDGTHARRLTPWKLHAGSGDWSPDGRWILLQSHLEQDRQDNLYLVHPNGSDLHKITRSSAHVHQWGSFSFSPDGTMITVAHNVSGDQNPDVLVMNLDGSGLRNVTDSAIFDSAPDWGPRPAG
jgi:TolB protein